MPGAIIFRGKLTPPVLDGIVLRKRLYPRLDQACARPLVWVTAPPGSGKTLLVVGYTRMRGLPLIWYQLDASDRDPVAFFTHLTQAAKAAKAIGPLLADEQHSLPVLSADNQDDLAAFTLRFFDTLLTRLPQPLFLVLDNYEVVDDGWVEEAELLKVLTRAPPGTTTFITSRHLPPKSAVTIQLQRRIEIFSWTDLRFDLDEARSLLGRDTFSGEVLQSLLDKTEGWAAGLVLMGESLRRGGQVSGSSPWIPMQDLFIYLDVEVFQKVSPDLQDFLIRTAYLSRMTSEVAALVSGNNHADRILHHLNRINCFTLRYPLQVPEFEYHPLMVLFLQTVAKHSLAPDQLAALRRQSAEILETSGHLDQAAQLLISAAALDLLGAFILRHAQNMVDQGRFVTLSGWIDLLPDSTLEREPWFLYWLALCELVGSPDQSRQKLRQAYEAFARRGDVTGQLAAWCTAVDSGIYDLDTFFFLARVS